MKWLQTHIFHLMVLGLVVLPLSACGLLLGAAAGGGAIYAGTKYMSSDKPTENADREAARANVRRQEMEEKRKAEQKAMTASIPQRGAPPPGFAPPPGAVPVRLAASAGPVTSDDDLVNRLNRRYIGGDLTRLFSVSVTSQNGIVSLYGTVPSQVVADRAVNIARATPGVQRVVSYLNVLDVKIESVGASMTPAERTPTPPPPPQYQQQQNPYGRMAPQAGGGVSQDDWAKAEASIPEGSPALAATEPDDLEALRQMLDQHKDQK